MNTQNSRSSEPQQLSHLINQVAPKEPKRPAQRTEAAQEEYKGPIYLHPKIKPQDFAQTMKNYRQFVDKYNSQVEKDNAEIKKYNAEIARHSRKNPKTDEQKAQEYLWVKKNKAAHAPGVYNALVERYNAKNGPCIRKMNLKNKIQPEIEKTFNAMLRMFGGQLNSAPKPKDGLEFYYRGPLRKYFFYPNKIQEVQQDDVDFIPRTIKTIRAHRQKLEEAGVFFDYKDHGPTRPVSVRFNPEIISVTDEYSRKISGTRIFKKSDLPENQEVSKAEKKKVPHNNDSTRSLKNGKELKQSEGVSAIAKTTQFAAQGSTGSPDEQDAKNSNTGAGKNHKKIKKNSPAASENEAGPAEIGAETAVNPENSKQLLRKLWPDQEFCEQLHSYQPRDQAMIAQDQLYLESKHGILTQTEFITLLVQQFLFYGQPIFKGQKSRALGSWFEAYRILQDDRFKTFTGRNFTKQEAYGTWLNMMGAMRKVLQFKSRHPEWVPAYPNLYFDPHRRDKAHNCFAYYEDLYKQTESAQDRREKRKIRAANDKRRMADLDKARHKVFAFVKGKIDLETLQNYTMKNCDASVFRRLDKLIEEEHKRLFPEEYK